MPRQFWGETLKWVTVDGTAIATSTAETVIFTDQTIFADYMSGERIIRLLVRGKFSTTTGPPTLRFRVRWGGSAGVLLADSGTMTTIASVTNAMFKIDVTIQVRSNGVTGTMLAMGEAMLYGAVAPTVGSATGAPAIAAMSAGGVTAPAVATTDLTIDKALSVTAQWSASSASNTLTGMQYLLKVDN